MELQRHPSPATHVIDFARLCVPVSVSEIQTEVMSLTRQPWVDHVNMQDYTGGWDVLPLRSQRQHLQAHPILQSFAIETGDDWLDLPVMDDLPTIRRVLLTLHCPIKAVRLMRLKSGAEIKPHRDRGLSIEHGEARLHLPVQTSEDILFTVNNRPVPMQAGELWYINADQVHAVHNRGHRDRINLVIDCAANDWLRNEIRHGSAQ